MSYPYGTYGYPANTFAPGMGGAFPQAGGTPGYSMAAAPMNYPQVLPAQNPNMGGYMQGFGGGNVTVNNITINNLGGMPGTGMSGGYPGNSGNQGAGGYPSYATPGFTVGSAPVAGGYPAYAGGQSTGGYPPYMGGAPGFTVGSGYPGQVGGYPGNQGGQVVGGYPSYMGGGYPGYAGNQGGQVVGGYPAYMGGGQNIGYAPVAGIPSFNSGSFGPPIASTPQTGLADSSQMMQALMQMVQMLMNVVSAAFAQNPPNGTGTGTGTGTTTPSTTTPSTTTPTTTTPTTTTTTKTTPSTPAPVGKTIDELTKSWNNDGYAIRIRQTQKFKDEVAAAKAQDPAYKKVINDPSDFMTQSKSNIMRDAQRRAEQKVMDGYFKSFIQGGLSKMETEHSGIKTELDKVGDAKKAAETMWKDQNYENRCLLATNYQKDYDAKLATDVFKNKMADIDKMRGFPPEDKQSMKDGVRKEAKDAVIAGYKDAYVKSFGVDLPAGVTP